MVPLREFTKRTPSALGSGGGGSAALLEAGVDTDAEDHLLGVIGGALSELSERFENENHSFILKTSALPRVDFEINWNRNRRDCDHRKDYERKYDCFCTFAPCVWQSYLHISPHISDHSLNSTCVGNIVLVFMIGGFHTC